MNLSICLITNRKIEVSKVKSTEDTKTIAALALGANLGDRFQNIELALRYLENLDELRNVTQADVPAGDITIIDTSFLYETAPMYVLDQPSFINCACLVSLLHISISKIAFLMTRLRLDRNNLESSRFTQSLQICRSGCWASP